MKNDAQIAAMDSEDGDAYAGNKLGAELLGFHGIEYIIFKDGAAKPASEITDKDLVYAIAVAGDLRNKCYQLQVSWAGADACPKTVSQNWRSLSGTRLQPAGSLTTRIC